MRKKSGMMLMEVLIYIGILSLFIGFLAKICFSCQENADNIFENAQNIRTAVEAGEIWRKDIREAISTPYLKNDVLYIKQKDGEIAYFQKEDTIIRQAKAKENYPLLKRIKNSKMISEARQKVRCWRWELELEKDAEKPGYLPLFTFLSVEKNPLLEQEK